jgi:hypothetical protein
MKKLTFTIAGAAAVATALTVATSAAAAPSGPSSVAETVAALEASGYRVTLNKVGAAPLPECTVSAVRPGREVTEMRSNARDRTVERVVYTTVYVDVAC